MNPSNVIGLDHQGPLDRAIDWAVMRELIGGIHAANDNFLAEEDKATAAKRLADAKEAYTSTVRAYVRAA